MDSIRLQKLRAVCAQHQLDAFLATRPLSLHYLLGFSGSSGVGLITDTAVYFITDFCYKEQALIEVPADRIIQAAGTLLEELNTIPKFRRLKTIGFEADYLTVSNFEHFKKIAHFAQLVPLTDTIETIAAQKSTEEAELIRKACDITVSVFQEVCNVIQAGVTEQDIATEISYKIRRYGGDGDAFEPVVLFGKNSAYPHGKPGGTKLSKRDIVQLDLGAVYKGYCADFSRIVFMGKPSRQLLALYQVVKEAQDKALSVCTAGIPANEIDTAARSVIEKAGYGAYFGHSIGHGLGLNVHMVPKISPKNSAPVHSDTIFTIEPGIYLPGVGGVRIEDVVYIQDTNVYVLTKSSRDPIIL
jgi:Xaa-Pro aminopeptidase